MASITIRPERLSDFAAIADLTVETFRHAFGSGEAEANLIEELRQQPHTGLTVLLVAEYERSIVGHIAFSPVTLVDFPEIPVCVLGPLGVRRDVQRQGIGTRLVQEGLEQCRQGGCKTVFVTGSLEYYGRFGFTPIAGTKLHTIFKCDHDMVLELEQGLLKRISGLVDYPEPWHVFL